MNMHPTLTRYLIRNCNQPLDYVKESHQQKRLMKNVDRVILFCMVGVLLVISVALLSARVSS